MLSIGDCKSIAVLQWSYNPYDHVLYVTILTIFITCITFETINLYVVFRKKNMGSSFRTVIKQWFLKLNDSR